jgi:hypothetical protein
VLVREDESRAPDVATEPVPRSETKFDAKKDLAQLYSPKNRQFERIFVPRLNFLAIDGAGDPDGPEFAEAMAAVYSIAYPIKFDSKKRLGQDYVVPPVERCGGLTTCPASPPDSGPPGNGPS